MNDYVRKRPTGVETFYIDDSSVDIGTARHALLGAVSFPDEGLAIAAMLDCKKKLGVGLQEEIKWNSTRFTREQRILITEEAIPVLNRAMGVLVIHEDGKRAAALSIASQLSDYCRATSVPGFVCRFDRNIIMGKDEFDQHAFSLVPPCAGWSEVDSRHDQLMQLADLFVGFQKLRIDIGLGRVDGNKLVPVPPDEGAGRQCELSYYLFAGLRYALWGQVGDHTGRPDDPPFKNNLNLGVRIYSTQPEELAARAVSQIRSEYMGCIH